MRKQFLSASLTRLVQAAVLAGLASTASAAPVRIDFSGGFTTYSVQTTGTYQIVAFGAQGGNQGTVAGGLGAEVMSDFALTAGQVLDIAVGGVGSAARSPGNSGGGGGGGGTFLTLAGTSLIVAGGGGGAGTPVNNDQAGGQAGMSGAAGSNNSTPANLGAGGTNGSGGGANGAAGAGGGGGGVLTNGGRSNDGAGGGASLAAGLAGGRGDFSGGNGGFGGGGGGGFASSGGGGGGYSGGGGARQGYGGGGGSYSSGLLNDDLMFLSGVNAGNGYLTLELLPAAVMGVPEPGSLALFGAGVIGLAATRRKTRPG